MLTPKRIHCVVLAALVVATVLAGCGGGGGSSTSAAASGEPLTKDELIAKGDAICQQARQQFEQLQQNPPTTAEDAATLTQKLVDISETELGQLRALDAPASLRSSMDAYLKALQKNVDVLNQGLKAAQQGDARGWVKAQAATARQQVDRLQLAQAVGFKECSRPAGTAPSSSGG